MRIPKQQDEIKAIVFDVGGVMYQEDTNYSELCKQLGLNLETFMKVWQKYRHRGSTGKISNKKYIAFIAKEMKTNPEKLFTIWKKIRLRDMKEIPRMKLLVKKLKKNKYIVGTLTNIMGIHHQMRKEIGAYRDFHFNICSCEVGLKKPDPRIYRFLLKKVKLPSREIIFIDDYLPCLEPAKKLGIKSILFKNNKQLVKDLKKLNVKI
jgi:putative hydrolase of the HAD superfamily